MRLFIAINFSDEIKSRLASMQKQIAAQCLKGNFSGRENLHLTLVFMGETQPELIPAIKSAMEATQSFAAFNLEFGETGFFSHSGKELWWVGPAKLAKDSPEFRNLAKMREKITFGLDERGINFDSRPFNPHITLGREIKRKGPVVLPEEKIVVPVNTVSLMRSERVRGALVHTEIAACLLSKL
jgi:2'-5' RNA ligase